MYRAIGPKKMAQKFKCNARTVSKEKTKSPNEVIASKILPHAKLFLHT
jgi:hypothetical protein